MRFIHRISGLILSAMLLAPAAAAAALPAETISVIVSIDETASPTEILSTLPGAELSDTYSLVPGFAAEVPAYLLDELASAPGVLAVDHDATFLSPKASLLGTLDPALISEDDLVIRSDDPDAGAGTVIAVLDSGFDISHPIFTMSESAAKAAAITEDVLDEIAPKTDAFRPSGQNAAALWRSYKIPFAFDYYGLDTDVLGHSSHGTHVAATAAGSTAGGAPISGTAPGAQLLLMKVFDDSGENCRESVLVSAIEDAVLLGADVINLSLGSLAYSSDVYGMNVFSKMLARAEDRGILIVCAAGNDSMSGAMGLNSDNPRASDPDYGLPSEPAIMPEAISAASAANNVVYANYMRLGARNVFYNESYEAATGLTESLADAAGGQTYRLVAVPNLGKAEDYENLNIRGAAALIRRGEITFEEKVQNAADAGAALAIIYDPNGEDSFLMGVGNSRMIPAVSIARTDGEYLLAHAGERLTVSSSASAFKSADDGTASYSSWGPTADLKLYADMSAVGSSVISALPDGKYGVMSGTSMAAPQISGMAARALSDHRALADTLAAGERAFLWKTYLMNTAQPITDAHGVPLSPRVQGAGMLATSHTDVLMQFGKDGTGAANLGDNLRGTLTVPIRLTNLTNAELRYTLRAQLITDAAEAAEDGVYYITGESELIKSATAVSGASVSFVEGQTVITLAAGKAAEITVTLTPDAAALAAKSKIFTNGFYLEGFITLQTTGGEHAASMPFMGFAGAWASAPMIDAMDWDGGVSYYGKNLLWLYDTTTSTTEGRIMGKSGEEILSALFAFSPDGDSRGDTVVWEAAPLRNIAEAKIEVTAADGTPVYSGKKTNILKSLVRDGKLMRDAVALWDGSDGINDHFHWADGTYTIKLTLFGYGGTIQSFSIPVTVDTESPVMTSAKMTDGVLTALFTDAHALHTLRIYLPHTDTEEDAEHLVDVTLTLPAGETAREAEISAAIPADVEYVYISAEDYAGNRTLVRYYV